MSPLTIVFLSLYAVISIVNLTFCVLRWEKWRKITKPFCLLFLIGFVLACNLNRPLIYIALIFDLIGDILFCFKSKKIFVGVGMIAFLAGHCFYIWETSNVLEANSYAAHSSWCLMMAFSPILILLAIYPSYRLSGKDWRLAIGGSIYNGILLTLVESAILSTVFGVGYMWMVLIGSILFYISDIFIALTLYKFKWKYREIIIMSTYLAAQILIVSGLLLSVSA